MFLNKLTLENFRCYKNLQVEFTSRLSVIVGVNGAGKSSILDAAALAVNAYLSGFDGIGAKRIDDKDIRVETYRIGSSIEVQRQLPVKVSAVGEIFGEKKEWYRIRQQNHSIKGAAAARACGEMAEEWMSSGSTEHIFPVIACYGTDRLWSTPEKPDLSSATYQRQDGYAGCLNAHVDTTEMMTWFEKMTYKDLQRSAPAPEFAAVRLAMEEAYRSITGYDSVKVQMNLDTHDLDIIHEDEKGNVRSLGMRQLSDGYRCTLFLIADIAYRMALLNPQLLDHVLEETDGLVLIDEVDLHLHPAWQQRVLNDLVRIFPKVQFIVTTHAPAVISSVKSESLMILNDGDVEGLSSESFGNDVNSILNQIMGVTERDPEVASLFSEFEALLAKKDYEEAEKILNRIDALRGYHDKQVAASRVKLRLERIRASKA